MKKIFFTLSPFLLYTVSGNSMLPKYKSGDTVVVQRILFRLKKNNVVILTHPQTGRLLLKRIKDIKQKKYFVIGDNEKESTDSHSFGWVNGQNIIGKVLFDGYTKRSDGVSNPVRRAKVP
ncbi:MAG TPA: nickel-type superoxide dismutase maturation protease [Candidatus Saccharimonadales bacterium]|nr:nickel-type superoxide dismutase maturation protease [Candidatus Saccharimonadales bacterium]